MKQLEIEDEELIISILNIQLDMGINMFLNEDKSNIKDKSFSEKQITSNEIEKVSTNIIITDPEKNAYDVALQAKDISSLENLFKEYDGCHLKKTANKFIKYEGNIKSKILIVDGTTESDEDKEGRPFVGDKGKLFEKMLNAINLKREDVFIANTIPWRPPGNRYPTNEEINICRPFILNLIYLLNPEVILCMGEVATNQILAINESIIHSRGKWHLFKTSSFYNLKENKNKIFVLPTFNISYLLKRPENKRQAWEDIQMFRDKIKEIIKT